METLVTKIEAPETECSDMQNGCAGEEENTEVSQDKQYTLEPTDDKRDIHNAKIIPVPSDGLCMHHCVHAAKYLDWMKNRNIYVAFPSTTAQKKKTQREHRP